MKKLITGGLVVALASMLLAAGALAASHHPTKGFAPFGECPLSTGVVKDCVYSETTSGSFTLGKKTVPIVKPVILQGGFEGQEAGIKFHGAENGVTFSATPQPVPGGLRGIKAPTWWPESVQKWFNNLINEGSTGVDARVELTGPSKGLTDVKLSTENLLLQKGIALGLPVKFHLENAALGPNCNIGSDADPVQINFTTGKSGSLKGGSGAVSTNEAFTLTTIAGGKLVNGQYEAPGASGCGGIFSFFVDPLVNEIVGVPAGPGKNSAILEGKLQDGNAAAVRASE